MFVNLTPHALNIRAIDGAMVNIAPSGDVARVSMATQQVAVVDGIAVNLSVPGAIVGLPAPKDGVIYIVSLVVAAAAKRADVVSPGTLIRGADGQPVGADGLSAQVAP